jgi:hypothetical protein
MVSEMRPARCINMGPLFLMAQWVKGRLTGLPFCYINKRKFCA